MAYAFKNLLHYLKYHNTTQNNYSSYFWYSNLTFYIVVEYTDLENKTLNYGKCNTIYLSQDDVAA